MNDICDDNRFELIEKYKKKLIEATNIETSMEEMKVLDPILFRFWQMGWLDKLDLPSAQPEQQWIPVTERLPENGVCVIVCFREWQKYENRYIYSVVNGWYARKHSVRENVFSEWEMDCDYDEDKDEYYILEGWYELTTQGNADLMNWYINAEVVAWMPLPEPYKGGGKDESD